MPLPNGDYVIFSGWGIRSNWFSNVRAEPRVWLQVGRRRMLGTARVVEDPQRRAELMRQMAQRSSRCGPPKPVRPLLKLTRVFDYQADIDQAVRAGGTLPVVEITPD